MNTEIKEIREEEILKNSEDTGILREIKKAIKTI